MRPKSGRSGSQADARASAQVRKASVLEAELPDGSPLATQIAEVVRSLRKAHRYSLDELAARSGVSRASLSQIEMAKTNPTIAILWRIAAGLEVPFAALLGDEGFAPVRVLRRDAQRVLRSPGGGMESRPLAPAGSSRSVEVYELTLLPESVNRSDAHPTGTTELLVVLSGTMRLHVGDARYELTAGDTVSFAADEEHAYDNPGRTPATVHNVIMYPR